MNSLNIWSKRLFIFYWIALIVMCLRHSDIIFFPFSYVDWQISDWLINYQGGFVRRGLIGQMIYTIWQIHPFDIVSAVRTQSMIFTIFLLIIVLRIFSKEGWSLSFLPFGFCFFFLAFLLWARRDCLLLVFTYLVFWCYRRYVAHKSYVWGLCFGVSSAVLILCHEAFFFFSIPILMVYGWQLYRQDRHKNIVAYLLPFVPAILSMAVVCINKGDAQTAESIWASWYPVFETYKDPTYTSTYLQHHLGLGVEALTWDTLWAFKFHATLNFLGYDALEHITWESLYITPLLCCTLVSIYVLVTKANMINISLYPLKRNQERRISNVLLVQFIFMIPLFSVLSCDWGRTLAYWVLSSLFVLHTMGDMKVGLVDVATNKIQQQLDKPFFNTPFFYCCVALFLPLFSTCGPEFENIPLISVLQKLLSFVG